MIEKKSKQIGDINQKIQIHVKDFSSNQLRLFIVTQSAIYSSLQKYVE